MISFVRKVLPASLRRPLGLASRWLSNAWQRSRLTLLGLAGHRPRIYYLGVPVHTNLGDLAQQFCTREWLRASYPTHQILEFGVVPVADTTFGFVGKLGRVLGPNDMIVFQSGYTTQDLGGDHDLMHRMVIEAMPEAPILMLPQTIFFRREENRRRTAQSYNRARRMLFLARDKVSWEAACEMFPAVPVRLFPDIVTTRIGRYRFDNPRERAMLCSREGCHGCQGNEKFYSDEDIAKLRQRVEEIVPTDLSDTDTRVPLARLRKNLAWYIEREIEKFSHYRLTITDRYHGTIFSLAANTPVIILRTTDHKVTSGAEWFRGVYDGYVQVADSLDHAFDLAREIIANVPIRQLQPHFDTEYYGKLKQLFEETIGKAES